MLVPPANLAHPSAFAAGRSHSVALTTTGRLLAFGDNKSGQCNAGFQTTACDDSFESVCAGSAHTVALTTGGALVAFGDNRYGQCNVPAAGSCEAFRAVSAGHFHTAAVTISGRIVSFGRNDEGQCGAPPLCEEEVFVTVSAGSLHTVALTTMGRLVAWGDNRSGQCDVPTDMGEWFQAASAGPSHTVALTTTGRLVAFGDNSNGQCRAPALKPGEVWQAVSAGWRHTAALTSFNRFLAFGDSSRGQCLPPPLERNEKFRAISAGYLHTMALTSNFRLVAFGYNATRQCNVPVLDGDEGYTDHLETTLRSTLAEGRATSLKLGVSAEYLLGDFGQLATSWAKDRNGNENPSFLELGDLTKSEPRNMMWCPRDGKLGCSFVDSLESRHKGQATHFLSWVWQYRLSTVKSALQPWMDNYRNTCKDQVYMWVCWFCNNQFRLGSAGEDLDAIFRKRLTEIGNTIAMLDSWQQSLYFTRAWCIYEQYVAFDLRAPVTVIMPEGEIEQLNEVVRQGSRGVALIEQELRTVDCRKAQASNPSDREAVLAAIENGPGADKVNEIVSSRMAQCFQTACQSGMMQEIQVQGRIADLETQIQELLRHRTISESFSASHDALEHSKGNDLQEIHEGEGEELQAPEVNCRVAALEAEVTDLKAENAELKSGLARSEDVVADLRSDVDKCRADIEELLDAMRRIPVPDLRSMR